MAAVGACRCNGWCNRNLPSAYPADSKGSCVAVPPEWGSGGRWFESSRPDTEGRLSADDSRPFPLTEVELTSTLDGRSLFAPSPALLPAVDPVRPVLYPVGANP